jgi:hypothetical protein
MERHGLSQKHLIPEFGVESTVSLVLSGKRKMNRDHIARLSQRFHVPHSVFFLKRRMRRLSLSPKRHDGRAMESVLIKQDRK